MTKSISRSQVRLIASTNAIFGADEACAMLRISRDAMYRLAKDRDDPFPIRYIGGKTRDGIVHHSTEYLPQASTHPMSDICFLSVPRILLP